MLLILLLSAAALFTSVVFTVSSHVVVDDKASVLASNATAKNAAVAGSRVVIVGA